MGARRRQPVSVRDETRSVPGQAERITVAATDAQNEFGRILEHAVQDRVVVITRHNAPRAVLMSFDRYTALTAAGAPSSTRSPKNSTDCPIACRRPGRRRECGGRSPRRQRSSGRRRWPPPPAASPMGEWRMSP